jgi:hypothetical protein
MTFLEEQAKTKEGQDWYQYLKAFVDTLYSTKGIQEDLWKPRRQAAELIEKEILVPMEVGTQRIVPEKNNEYV